MQGERWTRIVKEKEEREREKRAEARRKKKRRKKKFSAPLNELGTGRIFFSNSFLLLPSRGILRENSAGKGREREGRTREKRRGKSTFYYLAIELLAAGFTNQLLVLNWQLRNARKERWRYY